MFKRTTLAIAFVGALAIGGLSAGEAQAHHRHGPGGSYLNYYSPFGGASFSHRAAYYGPAVAHPRSVRSYRSYRRDYGCRHDAYYGRRSAYYGGGPSFRLSIGF